ncbi:MarR family transcriptional regulator [uncultured Shewanella sp.]|uniref:MarR family winged helix-turn-helix transcriptional regulator n=1 Tax=uncultured Shewanella sp. TaxID=173975 RepID=UPI00262F8F15|nr:MarR family transcriptional regulator [uncultured Shewanella sp.]
MNNMQIHEAIFRLAYDIKSHFSDIQACNKIDLAPMHMRALRVIWSQNNTTAHDIALVLKRDKAQIARLVTKLLTEHFIEKQANPNDKRSQFLSLTNKGRQLFERFEAKEKLLIEDMTQEISAQDLETFLKVSQQLSQNLLTIKS